MPKMLVDMVANFDAGAAAKIVKLAIKGNHLRELVEWTPYGIDAVRNRGYSYLSAEFHEVFKDNEQGKQWGCVLLGAALTTRPEIKRLDPVQLSHDAAASLTVYVADYHLKTLVPEQHDMWKKYQEKLRV